ncbi:serine hydrolase domain-containing protein [Stenotrophomonas bentonitica]|uniref:serine hydrolase domain-containing protein n=1 Tax=Stenotrophomonas bentonitica TaxID=1450134 RepID=UPI0037D836D8
MPVPRPHIALTRVRAALASSRARLAAALVAVLALPGAATAAPASPTSPPLSAEASDPRLLGWMQGAPPPEDKRIRYTDDDYFSFPKLRWTACHFRQLMPTVGVSRGPGAARDLPRRLDAAIDALSFTPTGTHRQMTWAQSLSANYTDGIVVLHDGVVVYERYSGCLDEHGQHGAMSVSKSMTGLLGEMLVAEGVIVPPAPSYTGPRSYYDYLQTVQKQGRHGEAFGYKTINTDALGWIIARRTGQSVAQLLQSRIWQRLGAEQDAYYTVDSTGTPFAGGGFNAGLRDLARVGQLLLDDGKVDGQPIVPAAAIARIRAGGSKQAFAKAGYAQLPGWSYRGMWWISHNDHGAYMARGVHGQALYIDPTARVVIARFGSHPVAANSANDPTTLPAFDAVARYLMAQP